MKNETERTLYVHVLACFCAKERVSAAEIKGNMTLIAYQKHLHLIYAYSDNFTNKCVRWDIVPIPFHNSCTWAEKVNEAKRAIAESQGGTPSAGGISKWTQSQKLPINRSKMMGSLFLAFAQQIGVKSNKRQIQSTVDAKLCVKDTWESERIFLRWRKHGTKRARIHFLWCSTRPSLTAAHSYFIIWMLSLFLFNFANAAKIIYFMLEQCCQACVYSVYMNSDEVSVAIISIIKWRDMKL